MDIRTYDANGHLLSSTDAEGRVTRTEYDANGKAKYSFDALNHRTEYKYDEKGQLIETIYADGTSTQSVYDDAGRQIASINQAGVKTVFVYDALGRLIETIEPDDTPNDLADNPRTKTEYDLAGQVLAQIDQRGNRTTFSYDLDGRQTEITDALNFKTIFGYDNAGRRVSVKDALNHTTSYQYDAVGRNTKTIFADGTFTTTDYDKLGRRVSISDQAGVGTGYEYDALNRLTSVIDGLNQRTTYGYDELGRMVSQTDANGRTTSFEYDLAGQRVAKVLPLGQRFTYFYDAVGNLKSQTDANGHTATMAYDVMNRLTSESYQDGTAISYSYNAVGQRRTVTDSRGVTVFNYDVRDRLTSRVDPDGKSIAYTYDAASNRTSVTIPTGTTSYTFDALNRLDTVTNGSDVTDYDYNAVGNLVKTILPNGVVETRSYDLLNRLTKLEDKKGNDVLTGFTYTLDKAGMRTSVTEQDGRRVDYKYDSLYRLTEEKITDAVNGNKTVDYAFDAVGNRLSKTDDGVQSNYVYDANDRLISDGTSTYTYDANGNTLSVTTVDGVTVNTWDDNGRLVKVVITSADGTKTIEYQYNENNIRVSQKVDGVETRYLIDDNRDYAQVLEEYKPDGTIITTYIYGHDLISENRGGVKSFYVYDGLGSTRALTDSNGVVTDSYNYDAYGTLLNSTGLTANNYRFAGEQFDSNLGQYYLRDRYYSTGIGRFTRSDTYQGNTSNPISLNKYLYGNGNPILNIDPSGLFIISPGYGVETAIQNELEKQSALQTITTYQMVRSTLVQVAGAVAQTLARSIELTVNAATTLNRQFGIPVVFWGNDLPETTDHQFKAVTGSGYTNPNVPTTFISPLLNRFEEGHPRRWMYKEPQSQGRKRGLLDTDEFPYATTLQGGEQNYLKGLVSLHVLNASQNRSNGSRLKTYMNRAEISDYKQNFNNSKFLNVPAPIIPVSFGFDRKGNYVSVYDG